MKISSLLETPTTSVGTNDTQAPRFGRSNEMLEAESNTSNPTDMTGRTCEKCKEGDYQETSQHDDMDGVLHCTKCNNKTKRWKNYKEQVGESTTSGSVASVAAPLGGVQKRGQGSMFAGIKTSKKFPNSEGVAEASNPAQQAAIAISKKKKQGVAEGDDMVLDEKSKSKAQFRMMAAVAHNPKFAKKVGISKKVGKEFHSADKKSDYKSLPKKVDEAEFTEDKLANQLYRDLQIFKKGSDKDIGSKAKDKDIGTKPTDKEVHNKKTKATSKKLNK